MSIKTQLPGKGDLVCGHRVYAIMPKDLPAVPGIIVDVSPSGHAVTMQVDNILAGLGLPRRTVWTWRKDGCGYHEKGTPTRRGCYLVLDRRPKR